VVEDLPSESKALSSNPSTVTFKKRNKQTKNPKKQMEFYGLFKLPKDVLNRGTMTYVTGLIGNWCYCLNELPSNFRC
jgi:hypothetical protein